MYKTEPNCSTCNHVDRIQIEKLYEEYVSGTLRHTTGKRKKFTWTDFCNKAIKDYNTKSQQALRNHFIGMNKKGRRFKAHYGSKSIPDANSMTTTENRKLIEDYGLEFIKDQLDLYRETDVRLPVSQITQLFKALTSSQDKTKELKLKELELAKTKSRSKSILEGAIYGGEIKEAQIDDTNRNTRKSNRKGAKATPKRLG